MSYVLTCLTQTTLNKEEILVLIADFFVHVSGNKATNKCKCYSKRNIDFPDVVKSTQCVGMHTYFNVQ